MNAALGPVEVLVIGFPGSQFNGRIIPEVQALIDRGVINLIDGLLIHMGADGEVELIEFEQPELDGSAADFQALMGEAVFDLVSADDVAEFAKGLEPGSSAAVLVFENTWAKPFRDAVVDSGGFVVTNLRVPGMVVQEVLDALSSPTGADASV